MNTGCWWAASLQLYGDEAECLDRGQYHGLLPRGLLRAWRTFRVSSDEAQSHIDADFGRRQQKLGQMLAKLSHMAEGK
jgi:hypothetical protein